MQWFRLYDDLVFNAKAQALPPKLFKHWINLMCLASRNDPRGYLPSLDRISFALRMKESGVSDVLQMLSERGFIEKDNLIHDWSETQRHSDDSSIRKRASRISKIADNVTGPERDSRARAPDTEQIQNKNRTDTDTEKKSVHGEFGHVQLTADQYSKLDSKLNGSLKTYIDRFDRWAEEQPRKAKGRQAYLSILNWFERDQKEKPGLFKDGNGEGKYRSPGTEAAREWLKGRLAQNDNETKAN